VRTVNLGFAAIPTGTWTELEILVHIYGTPWRA
jgi:hypothetical protein